VKKTAWVSSAADSFVFPLYETGKDFYKMVYIGYPDGMAYFVPGEYYPIYIPALGGSLPDDTIPDCHVPNKQYGYDPRCRPWFQKQIVPENLSYTQVTDPYLCSEGQSTCLTITDQVLMKSGYHAVTAIDLNFGNEWYESVIKKYLNGGSFDKWYISDQNSSLSLNSLAKVLLSPENVSNFLINSFSPEVADGRTDLELRAELLEKMPPKFEITEPVAIWFTDFDNQTNEFSNKTLV
jgi:hypothetical protein